MPPRYAYWTILIDQKPTAFRAREREELLPTFHQLSRKNTDVVMKWFARGRLWESPDEAQAAQRAPKAPLEKRGHAWRPGGAHRDPRERFKKRAQPQGATKPAPWRDRDKPAAPRPSRPWADKPKSGPPRGDRPWGGKPPAGRPRGASGKTYRPDQSRGQKPFPARKLFPPRGGNDDRKPWQRERPPERRNEAPPKHKPETPAMPPGPPPSEQIRTKPKPPEKG
jgi:hypothetical protein